MQSKKGFTLMEVVAVIVIISMLSIFIYSRITNIDTRTKEQVYESKIKIALSAAKKYGSNNIDDLSKGCTVVTIEDLINLEYITEDIDSGVYTNPLDNSSMNDEEICITYERGQVQTRLKNENDIAGEYSVAVNITNGYTRNKLKYVSGGGSASFQLISNEGYNFDHPIINCTSEDDSDVSYSLETIEEKRVLNITNVNSNITCNVTGRKQTYLVSITGTNATVNPSEIYVEANDDAVAQVTADAGYTLTGATYSCNSDSTVSLNNGTLTIYNVTANTSCTIEAKRVYYNVLASVSHGSVTSTNPVTVAYGGSNTFAFTINTGYNINNVEPSCNFTSSARIEGNSLIVSNVQGAGTCTITPNANTYTITFNANGGSGLTYSSKTVTYGETYGDLPTINSSSACGEYSFDGWYTAASGGSQITSSSTVNITEDKTLYAHRSYNSYGTYEDESCNANGYVVQGRDNKCTGEHETRTTTTACKYYPTCNSSYSSCSSEGYKTRICTYMYGGQAGSETQTQTCQSETKCSDWSTCSSDGYQTRTCKYKIGGSEYNDTSKTTRQGCNSLTTCSDWSTCALDGYKTRTCTYMNAGKEYDDTNATKKECCSDTYFDKNSSGTSFSSTGTRCWVKSDGSEKEVTLSSCQPACNTSGKCKTTSGETVARNDLRNRACTTTTYTCTKAATPGCAQTNGSWDVCKSINKCCRKNNNNISTTTAGTYNTLEECQSKMTGNTYTGYTCTLGNGGSYTLTRITCQSPTYYSSDGNCYESKDYDKYTCDGEVTPVGSTCKLENQTSSQKEALELDGWSCY